MASNLAAPKPGEQLQNALALTHNGAILENVCFTDVMMLVRLSFNDP